MGLGGFQPYSRGEIPGKAPRAFPGCFRKFSEFLLKSQPYWGYGPFTRRTLVQVSDCDCRITETSSLKGHLTKNANHNEFSNNCVGQITKLTCYSLKKSSLCETLFRIMKKTSHGITLGNLESGGAFLGPLDVHSS